MGSTVDEGRGGLTEPLQPFKLFGEHRLDNRRIRVPSRIGPGMAVPDLPIGKGVAAGKVEYPVSVAVGTVAVIPPCPVVCAPDIMIVRTPGYPDSKAGNGMCRRITSIRVMTWLDS
ncbi:MAG: hypothetical protein ACRYGI_14635 [Janthinobacterium lividum]